MKKILIIILALSAWSCQKSKKNSGSEKVADEFVFEDVPEGVNIIYKGHPHLVKHGENGKPGLNGLSGAPGQPGPKGDKGEGTGTEGPKGEKGDTGAQGAPGTSGNDGKPGRDGSPGRDGKDGKDGPPGHDGQSGRQVIHTIECTFQWPETTDLSTINYKVFEYSDGFLENFVEYLHNTPSESERFYNSAIFSPTSDVREKLPIDVDRFQIKLEASNTAYVRDITNGVFHTFSCPRTFVTP